MLKEKAYAKVNLFLNVTGRREDGYHDLEMVMASVDFFDLLTFELLKTKEIIVESNVEITTDIEENLVYKIAKSIQEDFEIEYGVKIYITKNIPIAAGLAGGSADAAATLRGLNKLWKLDLSLDELSKIGIKFGADIPFCIYNKLCIAKGKGEELLFINKGLKFPILLINPNVKVSTKDVFTKLPIEDIGIRKINDMAAGIYNCNFELIEKELFNALEKTAFAIEPKIEEIKNKILGLGVDGVLMSGSGATIFAISKDKNKLKTIMDVFSESYFTKLTKIR
jgi:4-diphosphocytidyl-2C-methyl-D-erythritol kinase